MSIQLYRVSLTLQETLRKYEENLAVEQQEVDEQKGLLDKIDRLSDGQ